MEIVFALLPTTVQKFTQCHSAVSMALALVFSVIACLGTVPKFTVTTDFMEEVYVMVFVIPEDPLMAQRFLSQPPHPCLSPFSVIIVKKHMI